MLKSLLLFYVWLIAQICLSAPEQTSQPEFPKEGTYVGFIHFDDNRFKIPTSIEFVRGHPSRADAALHVYWKLMFGGFQTHEYLMQYYGFPQGVWNYESPLVALSPNAPNGGPDLALNGSLNDDGTLLKGIVNTVKGQHKVGQLIAFHIEPHPDNERVNQSLSNIFPDYPVIPAVTGEYFASEDEAPIQCERNLTFQLEAIKKSNSLRETPNSFAGYEFSGRVAKRISSLRTIAQDRVIETDLKNIIYNFYSETLLVPYYAGIERSEFHPQCEIEADGLRCGGCMLKKSEKQNTLAALLVANPFYRVKRKPEYERLQDSPPLDYPFQDEQIQGRYLGFLHMEERNVYEKISLEVQLAGRPRNDFEPGSITSGLSHPKIAVTGNIFIAGGNLGGASIPMVFASEVFPEETFDRIILKSKSDALLKITLWNQQGMFGVWYSKTFGRVGTFSFGRVQTGHEEEIKCGRQAMPLAGTYINSIQQDLIIDITPAYHNPAPPYFPFAINGIFYPIPRRIRSRNPYFPKHPVTHGVFDPFTGSVGLLTKDGKHLVGKLKEQSLEVFESSLPQRRQRYFNHKVSTYQNERFKPQED